MIEGVFQGLPALLFETAHARAAVSLQGGQLLSYVPQGFDDLLWLSPLTRGAPDAIRGGVPVCWPYFGRQEQPATAPQHGFARNTIWKLLECVPGIDDGIDLHLALPHRDGFPLQLHQHIHVGRQLRQSLVTRNVGNVPIRFTQALHTYLRVGDAMRVEVAGLDGLDYTDKFDAGQHTQTGEWNLRDPRDPGRSDRIYHRTGAAFSLVDPALRRRIDLHTSGSHSVVVWNPGAAGIAAISDAPPDGWQHFICLETANAGEDVITLVPGQQHTLRQALGVAGLAQTLPR